MIKSTGIVTAELMAVLKCSFALDWLGIHGVRHWGRVRTNGLRLAALSGANPRVTELFAVLHDACRLNEGTDPGHGARAAEHAVALNGRYFDLEPTELDLLCEACIGHSDGELSADITVQVCWDADRLDLGRVGITPDPRRLCTPAARDPALIEWALVRSRTARRRRR